MTQRLATALILLSLCLTANADVWRWVDALGKTHYVDTMTPIYTWVDQSGKVYYSDKPGHEDAVSVELVWHSRGSIEETDGTTSEQGDADSFAYPGETEEQRDERRQAEAYYCKRATEVYESYLGAPELYRTNEAGEREILNEEQAAATIADTKKKKEQYCR